MRTQPLFFSALAALSLIGLGLTLTASPAQAQVAPKTRAVDLKVEAVDLREAVRAVFKQVGVSYTISPMVLGTVTASYTSLDFEDALRLLLRQVGATWRVEGGVYQILSFQEGANALPPGFSLLSPDPVYQTLVASPPPPADPTVVTSDATSLYVVRMGVVHKIDKATMKEVGKVDVGERKVRIRY